MFTSIDSISVSCIGLHTCLDRIIWWGQIVLVEEWWMEWWRCLICTRPEHLIAFYSASWGRHVTPLLMAFNKLKIMSEFTHDNWKGLKLFTDIFVVAMIYDFW
jgi:hypothetical protein